MTKPHAKKSWWSEWLASWRSAKPEADPPRPHASRDPSHISPQKQQRHARRDSLYGVIREGMLRAGVLSSAYKFKVLTLDHEGLSYLVLIDIQPESLQGIAGGQAGLENGLRVLAQERAHLLVKSVYWRLMTGADMFLAPPPAPRTAAHEAITHDEIAALQQALAGRPRGAPASDTPDFAATEILVKRPTPSDHPLSDTQMGDLR